MYEVYRYCDLLRHIFLLTESVALILEQQVSLNLWEEEKIQTKKTNNNKEEARWIEICTKNWFTNKYSSLKYRPPHLLNIIQSDAILFENWLCCETGLIG